MQVVGMILGSAVTAYLMIAMTMIRKRNDSDREHQDWRLQQLRNELSAVLKQKPKSERIPRAWNGWRRFVVDRKIKEHDGVYSFYLVPQDYRPLPAFLPGQFLSVAVAQSGESERLVLSSGLTNAPNPHYYRITIQYDDLESCVGEFCRSVHEGLLLDVEAPGGEQVVNPDHASPIVLLARNAGVGVAVGILESLSVSKSQRSVTLVYETESLDSHPMQEALDRLVSSNPHFKLLTITQRLDDFLESWEMLQTSGSMSDVDTEFYLCGAPAMNDLAANLKAVGVATSRIKMNDLVCCCSDFDQAPKSHSTAEATHETRNKVVSKPGAPKAKPTLRSEANSDSTFVRRELLSCKK